MTQALPVQVSPPQALPAASPGANGAENTDSGSFAKTLAGQLAGDGAPASGPGPAPETTASAAPESPPTDNSQAAAAMLAAAGGKTLPPAAPTIAPVEATTAAPDVSSEPLVPQELLILTGAGDRASGTASVSVTKTAKDTTGKAAGDDADSATLAALAALLGPQPGAPAIVTGQPVAGERHTAPALPAGLPAGAPVTADLEHSVVEAATTPVTAKAADTTATTEAFKTALTNPGMHAATDSASPAAPLAAFDTLSAAAGTNNVTLAPLTSTTGQISIPVGHNAWGQAFSNQVVWAVNHGASTAELHLSPPELGPVSVRLSLDQNQASIAFSSPHAAVRDAIEAAMPRLRDMLGSQGITLADVNVSQHQSHAQRESGSDRGPAWSPSGRGGEPGVDTAVSVHQSRVGMLDVFV